MKKNELRKIYKEKRKHLSVIEMKQLQENIYQQIFEYDFSLVKTVHIFLSIKRLKEIDTKPIIDFLLLNNKSIVVSKSDFSANTLQHFLVDENTNFIVNSYGIPEPVGAKKIDVKKIDLVFVPLLISDKNKYRIGYGKGFYDRFLSECKTAVKTVGLNFFKPIEKIEELNEFDVALQQIIYPK